MSNLVSGTLIEVRKSMGFNVAKTFYQYMHEKFELGFNYSYYMRIEKGTLNPSAKIINTISSFLSEENAHKLIFSYCSSIFPKQKHLFDKYAFDEFDDDNEPLAPFSIETQIELTLRQVSLIGKSKSNYYLFWISTLSRYPIEKKNLTNFFSENDLEESLEDLTNAKLIFLKNDILHVTNHEIKFPKALDSKLKDLYKKFDEWDEGITTFFHFQKRIKKKIARRVSPRYIELLESQLNNLLEFVNAAEEVDKRYNNEVCMINIEMFRGKMPG